MMSETVKRLLQKSESTLLRAASEITQVVIAERSGLSTTLVSNLLAGKDGRGDDDGAVRRVLLMMAAANLIAVPADHPHVDRLELRSLQILSRKRIEDMTSEWGDL